MCLALPARVVELQDADNAVVELGGVRKTVSVALTPEPPMDEVWAEPEAFGGCSTQGQAKPDQPQPVHFVRTPRPERAPEGVSV